MRNVFVLGLDDFNRQELRSIREAGTCNFIGLLTYEEAVHPKHGKIDFDALKRKAEAQLTAFPESIDGIVSFWDFPCSALAGVLRNELGLPGPSNESIAKCEHKFWSRLEQREVVPDMVPKFRAFDPTQDDPLESLDLAFPFWVKPVKAHSSHLGFKIRDRAGFYAHLPEIREKIGLFGAPFDQYLRHVEAPGSVRPVNGHWCIAESIISAGQQCTLEGYVHDGEVTVYGVVDSVREGKHRSCFQRYQYPSQLPRHVQERMIEAASRVMTRFGYDGAPFNMEFYWDRRSDDIRLLEVNARISKSHCPLFRMVDGASHQEVMVDLAIGQRPAFPSGEGPFRIAGKFMVRFFTDGVIKAMPDEAEIARVEKRYPEARVRLLAHEGQRLTHMDFQDSYSFEVAEIFLGGNDQRELLRKYRDCLQLLTFDIETVAKSAA
jgi:hypothetical protein